MKYEVGDYILAKDEEYDYSKTPIEIIKIDKNESIFIRYHVNVHDGKYFFLEHEIIDKVNYVKTPLYKKLEGLK